MKEKTSKKPSPKAAAPSHTEMLSPDTAAAPSEIDTALSEMKAAPSDTATLSSQTATVPSEIDTAPSETATLSSETAAAPSARAKSSSETAAEPSEIDTAPSETAAAPFDNVPLQALTWAPKVTEEALKLVRQAEELISANFYPLLTRRKHYLRPGIRTMGFIDVVETQLNTYADLTPKFFDVALFRAKLQDLRRKSELRLQIEMLLQMVSDEMLKCGDEVYSDALLYYNATRIAKRNNEGGSAEAYRELSTFFHRTRRKTGEKTRKELKRDAHGLIDGTKDGKMVIENRRPQSVGGYSKVTVEDH